MSSIYSFGINDFFWTIIFVFITFTFIVKFLKFNKFNQLLFIVTLHCISTVLYFQLSLHDLFDANQYFLVATEADDLSNFGFISTDFIYIICYFLINYLNFGYFSCYLFFSFFGLFAYSKIFLLYSEKNLRFSFFALPVLLFLMLLPSVHFYTSMIGKDSLMFFSITNIILYVYDKKMISFKLFLFSFILAFFVRPHIAIALLLSFVFLSNFLKNVKFEFLKKLVMYTLLFSFLPLIYLLIKNVFGIANTELLFDFFERRVEIASNVGGTYSVDMKEMNFIERFFTTLLRPFLFDIKNSFGFVMAIENLFWFILFIRMFILFIKNFMFIRVSKYYYLFRFSVYYSIIVVVSLSYGVGDNLILFMRQKIQVLVPIVFIFMILESINIKRKIPK
tara:strand:- start:9608 stop:10783 length:1176 start_codon:yes stop_codon:yes gene_type:complete